MKYRLFRITRFMLWLIPLFWSLIGHVLGLESSQVSLVDHTEQGFNCLHQPLSRPSRSILSLSHKPNTTLVATLDGTMNLVEVGSMRVIWSFPTGSPIYQSYQAPLNKDNIKENVCGLASGSLECGDDWALYIQSEHFGKMRLSTSVADFVAATPTFSDDGGVILGSKRSTLFEVDAISGELIRSYAADHLSALWNNDTHSATNIVSTKNKELAAGPAILSTPELLLKIIRTDYSLQGVSPRSGKVLWTMNVAEFKASLFCEHDENLFTGASLDSEDKYASNKDLDFAMPYACHELKEVHRLRKNLLFGDLTESLPEAYDDQKMLPVPTSDLMLLPQSNLDVSLDQHDDNMMLPSFPNALPSLPQNYNSRDNDDNAATLSQPPKEISARGEVDRNRVIKWSRSYLLLLMLLIFSLSLYHLPLVKRLVMSMVQNGRSEVKVSPPKKRRARKSGKNTAIDDDRNEHLSSKDEDAMASSSKISSEVLPHVKKVEGASGRQIGKLFISNKEIAKGSNGTIVLEGMYEGRAVAIKRLVQAHHDIAIKEIQNLIASDHHPNIVRWHGVESDQDFIYLALERCICNLDDLIQTYTDCSSRPTSCKDQSYECLKVQTVMGKDNMQELWKANGYPSSLLLKLTRGMVSGLAHLHELGIIHRDLKPQNILITKERHLTAKVSDMGISKRLLGDVSSFSHNGTGCGSSGWQAPEQLHQGRQTRAVDLFSLGCILFFCITKGKHPFGERLERDFNIVKDKKDLSPVKFIPEAEDLISGLLSPTLKLRPKAMEVLRHPFFWSCEMRNSFLRDASDRVELEDRKTGSILLMALESVAPEALGGVNWGEKMEPAFIKNIGQYRRYKFDNVRDLLRVMRNKLNHYRELPPEIQQLLGPLPEGFNDYFARRFPKLLIKVYRVVQKHCKQEECFQRYFKNVD